MKFKIEDIPQEGAKLEFEENSWGPDDLGEQVAALKGPVRARFRLEKQEDGLVQASGTYTADLELICGRCLEKFAQRLEGDINLVFLPKDQESWAEEVELAEDDMEVSFYTDEEIDLSEALRDELALSVPMAPVCGPDCPGLCPTCGKPLAAGDCGCQKDKRDPRWAKLAGLKLDQDE